MSVPESLRDPLTDGTTVPHVRATPTIVGAIADPGANPQIPAAPVPFSQVRWCWECAVSWYSDDPRCWCCGKPSERTTTPTPLRNRNT